jgi:DNA-binding Lrp family transcriptional regulator
MDVRNDGFFEKPYLVEDLAYMLGKIAPPETAAVPKAEKREVSGTVSAYCLVKIVERGDMMGVFRTLYMLDNVMYCDAVRDAYDIALLLNGDDHAQLRELVNTKVRSLEAVKEVDYFEIRRLELPELQGFIDGYEEVEKQKGSRPRFSVSSYVLVEIDHNCFNSIYPQLYFKDEVVSCDLTTGKCELILLVQAPSFDSLKRFINNGIAPIEGVLRTQQLKVITMFDM